MGQTYIVVDRFRWNGWFDPAGTLYLELCIERFGTPYL
jgi:hypothetical protein